MTQVDNSRGSVLARLQSAGGVVACATLGLWAMGGALVGVSFALRGTPEIALLADGGIALVYLVYLIASYIFAHRHFARAKHGELQ